MAFGRARRQWGGEGINLTPMVDVVFNLLIFIIITAQYTNFNALKVNLPKAKSGVTVEESNHLVITLTRSGQIFLNQELIGQEELLRALNKAAQQKSQPYILIQADEVTQTGRLVGLMDIASQAGLKKVSIETKK